MPRPDVVSLTGIYSRALDASKPDALSWLTIGTGFLTAPNRMVTAAHVITTPKGSDLQTHKPGDHYYLKSNTMMKGMLIFP